MGMIFLTSDERPFKEGDFIISHGIEYLPTAPDTTYIVFLNKLKEKDIKEWIDVVSFRLVFVIDKLPKLSKQIKDRIIIHESLNPKTDSYNKAIQAIWKYNDRDYVFRLLVESKCPIPLALAWVKANDSDPQTWRRIAAVMFTLPDTYCHAIMAFCIRPTGRSPKWPKGKTKTTNDDNVMFFRDTDKYVGNLLDVLPEVRNEIRETVAPEEQNIIPKVKESLLEWL